MIFDKGNSIKVTDSKCLCVIYNNVNCDYCIRHCPTNAIIYDDNRIFIDKEQCIGCGLCLQDCPTQVFSSTLWDETSIITDIQKNGWKVTEFFCAKHSAPYKKENDETRGALQIPTCFSAISRGAWYEIGITTKMEIHLENCDDCPMKDTINRLDYNIYTVSEWLEASGHSPKISLITKSCNVKTKKNLKAVKSALKVTSRRDFLITIGNKVKPQNDINYEKSKHFKNNKASLLPNWHRRLADVYLENINETNKELAYWPTIKKINKCINCGMCNILCPTKTLHTLINEDNYKQYFTSGLCIDCRLCQLFCPQGAIVRDRERIEKPFEPILLSYGKTKKCETCENMVYDYTSNLCYWCSEEDKQDSDAIDSYRKLLLNNS